MAIEMIGDGGFCVTGKEDIGLYRLMTMKARMKMEVKGMSFSGRSTSAMLKDEFGWKGNKKKILEQLEALIEEKKQERGQ